jgi:hypothetical protein
VKIKVVIAVAAVGALGAVVAAIWIGHRLAEPTVVADPYEAGLHYDQARHEHDAAAVGPRAPPRCDLSRGPCARAAGGATVTLAAGPRPLRAMTDLEFTVTLAPAGAAAAAEGRLALTMPGMYMGENRVTLAPAGEGRWQGRGVVVRCPSGQRTWAAEVELPPRAAGQPPVRAAFTFDVADR